MFYKITHKNISLPLGAYDNRRSFCSFENLMFIFKELIEREDISSGIYNVADGGSLSTNELISLISQSQKRNPKLRVISKGIIQLIAVKGDKFYLPLNSERLQKLISSYVGE